MKNSMKLSRFFKVLSVDTRVRIVQLLKDHALCVGALSARLGVTQGAVSQHLRILRDADLVIPEKRGYYVHYRLNERALAKWKDAAEEFLSLKTAGTLSTNPGKANMKGERESMCEEKKGCEKPEELTGKPEECAPEQIKKCHGDVKGHPCVSKVGEK